MRGHVCDRLLRCFGGCLLPSRVQLATVGEQVGNGARELRQPRAEVPSEERLRAKQMSVTDRSVPRDNAVARSIRRVMSYAYGNSPYARRNCRLRPRRGSYP